VSDVSDEDATSMLARMYATSRACRVRGLWRTTRHMDESGQHYTAEDRRPTNQVSARGKLDGEVAGHARLVTRTSRGCYAESGPVEFNLWTAEKTCRSGRSVRSSRKTRRMPKIRGLFVSDMSTKAMSTSDINTRKPSMMFQPLLR